MNSRTFREQDRRAPISNFAFALESVRGRAVAGSGFVSRFGQRGSRQVRV